MAENLAKRPAEIFGYPIGNQSDAAQDARQKHWCPFQENQCDKKMGVCSVEYNGEIRTICPHRFQERGSTDGVSRALEDIAVNCFGNADNIVVFPEVGLPNVGNIDYVIVKHKPMQAVVDDFVAVEIQSDSTTGTGGLNRGVHDFNKGIDLQSQSYTFGMNTYDSIKRSITQLINKGIVYEAWNAKCYWVIQEYIYANLVARYGLKKKGFSREHASVFALYDMRENGDRLTLKRTRFISTTVDEVYQAMRSNPNMPNKDEFVEKLNERLNEKLNKKLRLKFEHNVIRRQGDSPYSI